MRALILAASVAITALSLAVDLYPRSASSPLCLIGGCRYDQIISATETSAASPADLRALVQEDPGNPSVWAAYADWLAARGLTAEAAIAYGRAVELGPGLSAVLMRAANFDFSHARVADGLAVTPRILSQTDAFDQILFSYIQSQPVATLLGSVIPAHARPARSWLIWLDANGSEAEVLETWAWMRRTHLDDEKSAIETTSTLWQRKSYRAARSLWTDFTGNSDLIQNSRFDHDPRMVAFDWSFESNASVEFTRSNGLTLTFKGVENIDFSGLQQFTILDPGRYRFSADLEATGITTDQGPFFDIGELAHTTPILGTIPRTTITADFTVPPSTQPLAIRLVRRPSLKFDSKLSGVLHLYSVSLWRTL